MSSSAAEPITRPLKLTRRQREILDLICRQNLTHRDVADRLFISTGTVTKHIHRIYETNGMVERVSKSRYIMGHTCYLYALDNALDRIGR